MNNLILGNIIALIGSLIMVYSGLIKNKSKVIYVQTIQIILLVLSNIILGGITGAIINIISCIRNILCYQNKLFKKEKIIIIILAVCLSILFNNLGLIGLFPLISIILYTLFMDTRSIIKFKILNIIVMFLWCLYDLYIKSYSSAIFDILSIITNIIAICQILNQKRKVK